MRGRVNVFLRRDTKIASLRPRQLWPVAGWLFLTVVILALATAGPYVSAALFSDSAQIANSSFTTDTLNAPTGVTATGSYSITVNWTATTDTYASGHRV